MSVEAFNLDLLLRNVFGFSDFRLQQRSVCESVLNGRDVLLVMPTGAGKSLCYQLPTLAKPNARTLVISPLIALMEDQCVKMHALGLESVRIHSGRTRQQCREACVEWREGRAKFLFVSPERLKTAGFLDFLESNKPSLIAVDEAHCISMWGHDFRADYRQLGARLQRLRPANVVALTATATPSVQSDIITQLSLQSPDIIIDGFRRDNLSIEFSRINPENRVEALESILSSTERLPCIVYVSTRKLTEFIAEKLSPKHSIKAFHAGMSVDARQLVQDEFMRGELEIIVATNAFGMGVDKSNIRTVVHMSSCSSIEAYYQEIGRAGRDGLPSVAIMMHSPVDRRMLNFLLEQNYPESAVLKSVYLHVKRGASSRHEIFGLMDVSHELIEAAIEKLWLHGGLDVVNGSELIARDEAWEPSYLAQKNHRTSMITNALQMPHHQGCRMSHIVSYFGDEHGATVRCGQCDYCRPESSCLPENLATEIDQTAERFELMKALYPHQSKVKGQLYRDLFERLGWSREKFETLIWDLEAEGFVFCLTKSFEKNGQSLQFQRLGLTELARSQFIDQGPTQRIKKYSNPADNLEAAANRHTECGDRKHFLGRGM